jgi:hypothetical protein
VPEFDIKRFFMPADNALRKFEIKLVIFTENLTKAFACTIPYMHGIYEIHFHRNSITDMMSAVLLFAVYCNPHIKRFSLVGNPVRTTFNKTFRLLAM